MIRQYKSDKKLFKVGRQMEKAMKINHKFFTPPHVIFTLFLTLSLFTGCMTGDDSKTTEYKLSFSANGGTGEMESITK